jgi:hypothetical protein
VSSIAPLVLLPLLVIILHPLVLELLCYDAPVALVVVALDQPQPLHLGDQLLKFPLLKQYELNKSRYKFTKITTREVR